VTWAPQCLHVELSTDGQGATVTQTTPYSRSDENARKGVERLLFQMGSEGFEPPIY